MIKKNKLLDACFNGNGDVFEEVKKIRQHKPPVASEMDGSTKTFLIISKKSMKNSTILLMIKTK